MTNIELGLWVGDFPFCGKKGIEVIGRPKASVLTDFERAAEDGDAEQFVLLDHGYNGIRCDYSGGSPSNVHPRGE